MTRYAREFRVTVGDMYFWKNLPKIEISHESYFSPDRSLFIKIYGYRLPKGNFNYLNFSKRLEESGWEVLKMFPSYDEEYDILPECYMGFWVRKVEDVDIQEEKPDIKYIRSPRVCSCNMPGEECDSHNKLECDCKDSSCTEAIHCNIHTKLVKKQAD